MTILWLFNVPLNPIAGGTERMTQLIARGLSHDGHNCIGQLTIKEDGEKSLNRFHEDKSVNIGDLYPFLKQQKVDIVINQLGNEKWLLKYFLDNGGGIWHDEGGCIISCHHFNTRWPSALYYAQTKLHHSLRNYIDLISALILYKYYKKLQLESDRKKYRFVYDNSDYYITLSEEYNKYFIEAAGLDDTSKLISIGNPLSFEEISRPEIIYKKQKIVLLCARMDEVQKRISLALKAWKLLQKKSGMDEWTLKIVGSGDDLTEYEHIVQKKGIKNVSFEGRQSPEPYYKEASIFIMTSGYEGWGLTLTESLQRGVVPIVMDTSPVFKEIITHCYNGFLSKGSNVKRFAKYLHILMTDTRRLQAMQKNALQSAEKFTLEKTMEYWRQLIPTPQDNDKA